MAPCQRDLFLAVEGFMCTSSSSIHLCERDLGSKIDMSTILSVVLSSTL